MPKKTASKKTKQTKHKFNTRDVVALYLGKYRHESQIEVMNMIGAIVTGINDFSYTNPDHKNKANAVLASQHKWLPSLEYNREQYHKWMKNIEDNHETELILEV